MQLDEITRAFLIVFATIGIAALLRWGCIALGASLRRKGRRRRELRTAYAAAVNVDALKMSLATFTKHFDDQDDELGRAIAERSKKCDAELVAIDKRLRSLESQTGVSAHEIRLGPAA